MAQFGSALEWGSRGRKFNSCHPDQQAKLSLLRAKKTPIISVIFFAFFASLCPSQKTRQSEMRDARKMLATESLRSLQILSRRKNSADYLRKRNGRFLTLRQVFPFSQKVTQAELFAICSLSLAKKRANLKILVKSYKCFLCSFYNNRIKIRKILILRKAREAVIRRKNKRSLF